jgi:hypothetical protein
LHGIPQTHLTSSMDEAMQMEAAREAAREVRGLPLSTSAPLDPRSPIIVLNDDLATRCRFCPNAMATGCVNEACRRCCMNQGGLACPRHMQGHMI